jgi:hypothetical protein
MFLEVNHTENNHIYLLNPRITKKSLPILPIHPIHPIQPIQPMNKKRVRFNEQKRIYVIPSLDELPIKDLWWSNEDFNRFKQESMREIIRLLYRYPFFNKKQAIQILYNN